MKEQTKGYKVTNPDFTCHGFKYELGKIFKHDGKLEMCSQGFHFCLIADNCFNYYDFKSENRVFEIIAHGEVIHGDDKSITNEIEFVRELTWFEVLTIINTGKDNTGRSNSGYRNSGNWNSGYRNSGNWNSGYWNSGDRNSGDWNSGDWNSGYRNSGNWNSGDRNSGDSNSGYRNSGAFCTEENPEVYLFDKPTGMKVREWEQSEAYNIMAQFLNPNIWVWSSEMNEDEKKNNPSHETTEGYLKSIPMKEAWANMWHNLTEKNKKVFLSLPNFDKEKFTIITGIEL